VAAIYQRARPVTFEQVVGQEHVKEVLTAAIARHKLGHAYLFSGPRGVGKTTTARLLAQAVNCDAAAGRRPCGHCESCRLIQSDSHPDVIELDAASNNSVEDVRELREKVQLASIRGGTRVWILDEAHMLSRAAANALLKTLEEPPSKLIFVLATTEPDKLPPTILSRCQHFRFRRLAETEIQSKLERLCREAGGASDEHPLVEPAALELVARAADGAMRDAESLLERLLVSGENVTREAAEEALGLPPQERIAALARALAARRLPELFDGAAGLYHDGYSPRSVIDALGRALRDSLYRLVTAGEDELQLQQQELLRLIQALDDERERFVRHHDLYALEVTLIKGMNALTGNLPRAAMIEPSAAVPTASAPSPAATPAGKPTATPEFEPNGRRAPADPPRTTTPTPHRTGPAKPGGGAVRELNWHRVKTRAGAQLKAFLMPARERIDGQVLTLHYEATHKFHFTQLKERQEELSELIGELAGPGYTIVIEGPGETVRKKS